MLLYCHQIDAMERTKYLITILLITLIVACKKDAQSYAPSPNLIFVFKFDSTQVRLDSKGQPSTVPTGNAAQCPVFNKMSSHYIELAPSATTALGKGVILFRATETTAGGDTAIDFSKCTLAGNNQSFFSIPISQVAPGQYPWLRVSLAYQNYDVQFHYDTTIAGNIINQDYTGTIASFIGFNTYLSSYLIKTQNIVVNGSKKQGYWGFETNMNILGSNYLSTQTGQSPAGATTVVNPLFASSPIPAGSCVVTAAFNTGALVITGNETKDIIVQVSLSTNKSFEWKDVNNDGKWQPQKGENVVDMGIRGMIPSVQ